ncbi:tautomerase family protein [Ammoniphilus sp. YIM 78166]|uniref:tautomerase family protein n=1 Tax=Ammoniphilus sp. YIM 78166 TaxID=1644106 RepID=UPI00142F630E|nr:tautomerase family protein [Ammoniphilus sp. YIM 78166]
MPLILVSMKEGRSEEEKLKIMEGLTNEFVRITSMSPEKVSVIIEEVKPGNWSKAGKLI